MINQSALVTIENSLMLDISSCMKAFPPSVQLDLTLEHARDSFRLLGKTPTKKVGEVDTATGDTYVAVFKTIQLVVRRFALQYVLLPVWVSFSLEECSIF